MATVTLEGYPPTRGDVYREAARQIHEDRDLGEQLSCIVVLGAKRKLGYTRRTLEQYAALMAPSSYWEGPYITTFWMRGTYRTAKACNEHRITALCFMAAMADAGDLEAA